MSMFTEVYGDMLQQQVSVETSEGANAWGDSNTPPVVVPECMVLETTKRVVTTSGGVVLSGSQVYHDLDGSEDKFSLDSVVTLPSGRKSKVIQVDVMRLTGFPSHVIVYLE